MQIVQILDSEDSVAPKGERGKERSIALCHKKSKSTMADAAAPVDGGGNGRNQQAAPPAAASPRKALKITILIILFMFIIFLASFNASMRHLIAVQKKKG